MTLRQLEAFYWAAILGNFSAAAAKLHMTQSALSKRISELEIDFGNKLFDREVYRPKLTLNGRALLGKARQMLALQQEMRRLVGAGHALTGECRFGITELVALTWLPDLVKVMRESYPNVVLEPHIGLSKQLHEMLLQGSIDFAAFPMASVEPVLVAEPLADVEFAVMASPRLVGSQLAQTASLLEQYPLLTQPVGSGLTMVFDGWRHANGLTARHILASNSLAAIAEMVVAELGIGILPVKHFSPLLDAGILRTLDVPNPLPTLRYHLVYRPDETNSVVGAMCDIVRKVCDFNLPQRTLAFASDGRDCQRHEGRNADRLS
jgi:DNA-binding transcriptional LysR family regulator